MKGLAHVTWSRAERTYGRTLEVTENLCRLKAPICSNTRPHKTHLHMRNKALQRPKQHNYTTRFSHFWQKKKEKHLISRHPPSACRLLRMPKVHRGPRQEPPPCVPGFVQMQEQSAAATWLVARRPLQPGVELVRRGSGRRSSRPAERSSTERWQLRGWPCSGGAT